MAEEKKTNDLGDLIDMSHEMFDTYINEVKKVPLGEVKILIQHFNFIYNDMVKMKEDLVEKAKSLKDGSEEKDKYVDTINRVYLVLFHIEDKLTLLKSREKNLIENYRERVN